jgi:HAD superfamily hydrolase (TIGR01509 family)
MIQMNSLQQKLLSADAVIFDMDGLLVDTEPLWKIAEKQVFGQYGLVLSDEQLRQVMGFRLSEVVAFWYNYQPWPDPDFTKIELEIIHLMQQLIAEHAQALPGVYALIKFLKYHQKRLAIASSSHMVLIEAVVNKLGLQSDFELLYSAQFEKYGKPHPGIFIETCNRMQVDPTACVILEDSINGVIAAKAARSFCIAVPELALQKDSRYAIADIQLQSLEELFVLEA